MRVPKFLKYRWLRSIRDAFRFAIASCQDGFHFARSIAKNDSQNRAARLTAIYHTLEKGLSLREPKDIFGQKGAVELAEHLDRIKREGGRMDSTEYRSAANVLNAYHIHCSKAELSLSDRLVLERIKTVLESINYGCFGKSEVGGGVQLVSAEQIQSNAEGTLPEILRSRHSIRDFAPGQIPTEDVELAVRIAQASPSVCNRQATRLIAITDREQIDRLLSIQGGARGFGEQCPLLIVVASDLRSFLSFRERKQPWFDGGVYGMTLMLAFHYLGYGTCPLHWCVSSVQDKAVRELLNMDEDLVSLCLLAVGRLPSEFKVANSARLPVEKVLLWDHLKESQT